jgi:DNA-directed RNA polymerase specialized sigma24 family protein
MLLEAHYEAALNYFYFLLMDEGAALACALRAIKLSEKMSKSNPKTSSPEHVLIMTLSETLKKKMKKKWPRRGSPPKSDWKPPSSEILAVWKEYLRRSDPDSAEALVLRYILGFSITTISEALSVPEGTVYFRIGRGLEAFAGSRS